MGVPRKTIGQLLPGGISVPTLEKHFSEELVSGKDVLIASIKHDIVKAAKRGNVRAQTWLLERLDPANFGKVAVAVPEDAAVVPVVSDAKVEIYLPDNQRGTGDISPVTMFTEPPTIDAEPEEEK
jgi:hypothetical protein